MQVVPATEDRLVRAITVTGTLAAEEQVTLSMKVTGRLKDLYVDLGSRVTRGQVLARLTPTDFDLRESQSEAALQQARARLGLPVQGDDDRIDPEKTSIVRSAQAQLDEARLTGSARRPLSRRASRRKRRSIRPTPRCRWPKAATRMRSRRFAIGRRCSSNGAPNSNWRARPSAIPPSHRPLDGIVRERHVTVGQYLAAGSPAVTIVRVHPLRLRVAVPERDAQAGAGQPGSAGHR